MPIVVQALNSYDEMTAALRALLDLPHAKEQLQHLKSGMGTATPMRAWLDAEAALAKAEVRETSDA